MTFKLNDKVTMQYQTSRWNNGDVGRIAKINNNAPGKPLYLICFDSSCHQMHEGIRDNEHCYWAGKYDIKLRRQPILMKVE